MIFPINNMRSAHLAAGIRHKVSSPLFENSSQFYRAIWLDVLFCFFVLISPIATLPFTRARKTALFIKRLTKTDTMTN